MKKGLFCPFLAMKTGHFCLFWAMRRARLAILAADLMSNGLRSGSAFLPVFRHKIAQKPPFLGLFRCGIYLMPKKLNAKIGLS